MSSVYVGRGGLAQLVSRRDEAATRERRARSDAERRDRRRAEREDREFVAWYRRVEALADAAIIAAGYRKHHRSEWRRPRVSREIQTIQRAADRPRLGQAAVEALLTRAHAGDASCLPELRALFADPAASAILHAYGSPPAWLENDLIAATAGENLAVREASLRKMAEVRRDLAGPNPSPTESLLAERAAICWWIVNRFESASAKPHDASIRHAEFQQRRIDRAHARFLSALKTLATIRKLALPALQVNIGVNQVNQVGQADSLGQAKRFDEIQPKTPRALPGTR